MNQYNKAIGLQVSDIEVVLEQASSYGKKETLRARR
jgi:hypothetical protein